MAKNSTVLQQRIPPTATRMLTKDIRNGASAVPLIWLVNQDLPTDPTVKIAKMIKLYDADDKWTAVEVYGVANMEGRQIGLRTTLKAEHVLCVDEVMDVATLFDEIRDAETTVVDGEDEEDDEEEGEEDGEDEEAEPVAAAAKPALKAVAAPAKAEEPAALPSVPMPVSSTAAAS